MSDFHVFGTNSTTKERNQPSTPHGGKSHSKETENIHPHSSGNKNVCPGARFFNPCPKHKNEHTKPKVYLL
jgi:hypothetical protein